MVDTRSSTARVRAPDARMAVFDALADSAALLDQQGVITHVNHAWVIGAEVGDGDPATTGVGVDYLGTCMRAAAAGDSDAAVVAEGIHGVLAGRRRSFEYRYPCPSPLEDRWFVVRATPLPGGGGALVCHVDVTAAKLAEDRLTHQALHDPLTGLPNREAVLGHLRTALARRARTGAPAAVLYIDLDGFKPVNDRYGHETGDRLLARVANRLQRQMRGTDLIGRVGGDEFLAVCEGDAGPLADRLRAAVGAPLEIGGERIDVGVSIGVAVADGEAALPTEDQIRDLLVEADRAMYAEKRRHRSP
ncbi:MAG TPA: GGDEF domain-containing protein [Acidimicrobiales bacterium]|nr:GGDEF domain-containing protein [Acidimicrobiales bacterium]